ncbi:hypothetical protein [Cupriavidus oxalaticus]|uniref:hypothetical protein n=1 Tax=Cupriavidus oxalaticus TaxID=96344 RepID=UPI001F0F872F|nr:hypothetical protein [Cupriavidus oxalaticus]
MRAYRLAGGLPAEPPAHEALPLIHGNKGEAMQAAGLYRKPKTLLAAVAASPADNDPAQALLLRKASPHWQRHAYAPRRQPSGPTAISANIHSGGSSADAVIARP